MRSKAPFGFRGSAAFSLGLLPSRRVISEVIGVLTPARRHPVEDACVSRTSLDCRNGCDCVRWRVESPPAVSAHSCCINGVSSAGASMSACSGCRETVSPIEFIVTDKYLNLSKGHADIAIRTGEVADENLIGRKIAEVSWAVYASRSYVEHHGRPERTEDLNQHVVVAFDGEIATYAAA